MPVRLLRDGILTSERVCSLDWPSEIFYRRLMSVVDDFGRYTANPKLLRAALYPLQLDKVTDADIGKWTACAQKAGLVSVYPALDGKRYLELLDFRQQVKAKKSKFPPPITGYEIRVNPLTEYNGLQNPQSDSHLDGDGDGDDLPPLSPLTGGNDGNITTFDSDESKATEGGSSAKPRATRLPDDWGLVASGLEGMADDVIDAAREIKQTTETDWGLRRVRFELDNFRDYWHAKSGRTATKVSWLATWRTWLRRAMAESPGADPVRRDIQAAAARTAEAVHA